MLLCQTSLLQLMALVPTCLALRLLPCGMTILWRALTPILGFTGSLIRLYPRKMLATLLSSGMSTASPTPVRITFWHASKSHGQPSCPLLFCKCQIQVAQVLPAFNPNKVIDRTLLCFPTHQSSLTLLAGNQYAQLSFNQADIMEGSVVEFDSTTNSFQYVQFGVCQVGS